jgi:hypothetical protein
MEMGVCFGLKKIQEPRTKKQELNKAIVLRFSAFVIVFTKHLFAEAALAADVIPDKQAENTAENGEVNVVIELLEGYGIINRNTKSAYCGYDPGHFEVLKKSTHVYLFYGFGCYSYKAPEFTLMVPVMFLMT